MNIFMPARAISESVKSLDDNRLRKQILEIWQLCYIYEQEREDELFKHGYQRHPIYKYYSQSVQGYCFMQCYGALACSEYEFRFGKKHKLAYAFKVTVWGFNFHPAYIAGQKANGTQIIDAEDTAYDRYRQRLIEKWNTDKAKPKWTNREPPEWYNAEHKGE